MLSTTLLHCDFKSENMESLRLCFPFPLVELLLAFDWLAQSHGIKYKEVWGDGCKCAEEE